MKSALPEKDISLLSHALELNDQVVHILKESTKINDYAVCSRSHRCADCALAENVKNSDLAEGFFLLRQADTDLSALIKRVAGRLRTVHSCQGNRLPADRRSRTSARQMRC